MHGPSSPPTNRTLIFGAAALMLLASACSSASDSSTSPSATSPAASPTSAASSTASSAVATSEEMSGESTGAAAGTDATAEESASDTAATSDSTQAPAEGVVEFRDAVPGSGAGLKLGYISLGESVPFIATVTKSLQAEAAAAGAELIVCDSALDGQKAVDCAKSFATQGVQGYLNFQVDQALASAVCAAGPQVPVIAIDIVQQPCQTSFMGAANTYAGELAGKAVGEFAKKEWNCEYDAYVSLESTASVDANTTRMGGYRTGFESVCPAPLTNEIILDADRTDTAQTKFADVLTTLPGKSKIIVVGLNDDGLVGALAAARAAGREGDIYLSGQGADQSAWCEIAKNPNWIGDTGYFPEKYGKIGIPYLIDLVNGKDVPKDLLVPHKVITGANIADYYDVSSC